MYTRLKLSYRVNRSAQGIAAFLLLLASSLIATLVSTPAAATVDPQYVCTPDGSSTGSKCQAVDKTPWRWSVSDTSPFVPPGGWYNSEGEAYQAIVAAVTGPDNEEGST